MRNKETGEKDYLGILESSKKIIIGLIFMIIGPIIFFFTMNLSDYFKTRRIYKNSNFKITEGYVRGTEVIQAKNDHLNFYINEVYFQLSSNSIINYGCRFQDIRFYEIPDSTYLKISYFPKNGNNIILKIEKSKIQ